jgi:hypothetical protein
MNNPIVRKGFAQLLTLAVRTLYWTFDKQFPSPLLLSWGQRLILKMWWRVFPDESAKAMREVDRQNRLKQLLGK